MLNFLTYYRRNPSSRCSTLWLKSTVWAALALTLGAGTALAGKGGHNHVSVKNCMGQRILVCSYNGNDGDMMAEHDFKRLKKGNTVRLSCHKNGSNGCKLSVARKAGGTCGLDGKGWNTRFSDVYIEIRGTSNTSLREVSEDEFDQDGCTE